MNRITDDLYIGDIIDAVFLDDFPIEFDRVVSLVPDEKAHGIHGTVETTTHQHDLVDGENPPEMFAAAANDVLSGLEQSETTYVHCHAGVSRAAAVAVAALAAYRADDDGEQGIAEIAEVAYESAFDEVAQARPIVNPAPELRDLAMGYIRGHLRRGR